MTESDLPPVMILADHLGYAGGVPHGVTTYLLNVLPQLAACGLELTVCFLREPHPAARELPARGIHPVFLGARKWDPTVVWRVAALARRNGVRLLHATGVKGTLVGRIAARLVGARALLHVRFLGRRSDVPRLLSAVDLVVMPSRSEGLGLAAVEALAAARPVIVRRLIECYRMTLV